MSDIASIPNDATQVDLAANSAPFEGPEKLLEIWFRPTTDEPQKPSSLGAKLGLRAVDRKVWEDMLDIVRCKVLNMIEGTEVDAYLLSESSLFVFSHKIILKTCGTTLNLLGLPRILDIAATHCGLNTVYRFFYSRKSFMFPERQQGPHREWRAEVEYLDNIFGGKRGAAYTVGKVNGDHWLLYLTNPSDDGDSANSSDAETDTDTLITPVALEEDYTLEILMTKLSCDARSAFFFPTTPSDSIASAQSQADIVSHKLGIDSLFPTSMTTLDAFAFTPCGYSANALLRPAKGPEGYYTIHVTPEEGWSFASFECNVPLSHYKTSAEATKVLPDLRTLIQRVVQIFQPGHLSLTLFVTSPNDPPFSNGHANGLPNGKSHHALVEAPVDSAHRAFKEALTPKGYKRTDKINYEFGGYDLAFASFEAR